jgi:hypothetical protein
MKQNICAPSVPTANLAVNKSRVKLYSKGLDMPTYYLQKGQEFQIELFNPTSDVVLAKIHMNGKAISQGGLVINPGQRVFLDRYLDIAQKFLFDTYEVAKTAEVKKAIENNGDIKVEFYKERQQNPPIRITPDWLYRPHIYYSNTNIGGSYTTGTDPQFLRTSTSSGTLSTLGLVNGSVTTTNTGNFTSSVSSNSSNTTSLYSSTLDSLSDFDAAKDVKRSLVRSKKSIETGRVEKGSHSDQEFNYVNKSFEYIAFHTVEYKLIPVSQKINTVADINVKRYCTNCGSKLGKTDKFCANCGKKS